MNKRQKKKAERKEVLLECTGSYKEERKLDRNFHEYVISTRHKQKKCIALDCVHYMNYKDAFYFASCYYCEKVGNGKAV